MMMSKLQTGNQRPILGQQSGVRGIQDEWLEGAEEHGIVQEIAG
jgi:hypothetical protein